MFKMNKFPSFRLRDNSVRLHENMSSFSLFSYFFGKENNHVYCLMWTCAFWLIKYWRISICYRKVLYYFSMDIYHCPWHLRNTQVQSFYHLLRNAYQKGSKLSQTSDVENREYAHMLSIESVPPMMKGGELSQRRSISR